MGSALSEEVLPALRWAIYLYFYFLDYYSFYLLRLKCVAFIHFLRFIFIFFPNGPSNVNHNLSLSFFFLFYFMLYFVSQSQTCLLYLSIFFPFLFYVIFLSKI